MLADVAQVVEQAIAQQPLAGCRSCVPARDPPRSRGSGPAGARMAAAFASTCSVVSSTRSALLPDGSPIMPVPPPTTATGRPPCRWRWTSAIIGTRWPTWSDGPLASKPTYAEMGPVASRSSRPSERSWISPRHVSSARKSVIGGISGQGPPWWHAAHGVGRVRWGPYARVRARCSLASRRASRPAGTRNDHEQPGSASRRLVATTPRLDAARPTPPGYGQPPGWTPPPGWAPQPRLPAPRAARDASRRAPVDACSRWASRCSSTAPWRRWRSSRSWASSACS